MKRIYPRPGLLFITTLLVGFLLAGCSKEKVETPVSHDHEQMLNHMRYDEDFKKNHKPLHWRTILELLQVRWATAKYRDFAKADADGYKTIDVIVPQMGHHFMKKPLTDDGKFDLTKPEILVYRKNADGSHTLVAVEYAVPLNMSEKAPRGFYGNDDVWDRNTTFGLWLLHAWVWYKNPEGVFNPTNPKVHTH